MIIPIRDIHDFGNVKSVSIETLDYCNRKCSWCPNRNRIQSRDRQIEESIFDKAISELKALNYAGEIHPYFRNEPLADPKIHSYIRKIKEAFPHNMIRLNTNGDYLKTAEDVERLIDAGCSSIHISDYSGKNSGKARDKHFSQVTWFGLDCLLDSFNNRGGSVSVECKTRYEICPFIFQKIMLLSNGNYVLCCSDFHEDVVLGNAKDMTILEVWNSKTFRAYRMAHAQKMGKMLKLCSKCNFIT